MTDISAKKVAIVIILALLAVLSFLIVRPILLSIITGFILAFLFFPLYKFIDKRLNSPNISAFLICLLTILLIVLPIWFLTPILIKQSFEFFQATQGLDLASLLKKILPPEIFTSTQISAEIGGALQGFISKSTSYVMGFLANILTNFASVFLQVIVIFFTFFFTLRDGNKLVEYIKSLLPFSKDIEEKLFSQSKNITYAVIYGQIIIGLIQGVIVSISFFIFQVPSELFLSFLAMLASVLPLIGPVVVWVPVAIFFLVSGNDTAFFGIAVFGIFASTIDNFLRPIIVSRQTKVPSSLVLVGMIGGLFLFGILGLILGPLILAYLIIILEIYRNKDVSVFESSEEKS